jgi:hypothetical protein
LPDFNQNWTSQNNCNNAAKYQISIASSCFARGQTDLAKVGRAFLQFLTAKAEKDKKFWENLIAFPFIKH